jgi:hypothetical protein
MTGNKARQRERDMERERFGERGEIHSGERKQRGLILTVGLKQQHLQTLNT